MSSHHETDIFLLCVSTALDPFIGRRPDFVISDFCELLTQKHLYIYIYAYVYFWLSYV